MHPKIGILGFGVVGKSVLEFLKNSPQDAHSFFSKKSFTFTCSAVSVWDRRLLQEDELCLINNAKAAFAGNDEKSLEKLLSTHDYIVVSPGFDIRLLEKYRHKLLCELDIFAHFFTKPTIGITGTVGKTSTTHLLVQLMKQFPLGNVECGPYFARVEEAGNIGTGMLDVLALNDALDCCVLELSSFQLEQNKLFAPDIALWTNLYPNHLDRHVTLEAYADAKLKLLSYQKNNQIALLPAALLTDDTVNSLVKEKLKNILSQKCFVMNHAPTSKEIERLNEFRGTLFFAQDDNLKMVTLPYGQHSAVSIADLKSLPIIGYRENWLFILATLYITGYDLAVILGTAENSKRILGSLRIDSHRLEKFITLNGVDFYDDSKATIVQATLAAAQALGSNKRPIILIVGGLGKGVDRATYAQTLLKMPQVKRVLCFGNECSQFAGSDFFSSLNEVVDAVFKGAQPGDQVLFSPSGASFDFFNNYRHRGDVFKELVKHYGNSSTEAKNC